MNRLGCLTFFFLVSLNMSAKPLVSSPIQCWCPAQFEDHQVAYINNYCWVRNTYVVDFNQSLPMETNFRYKTEIQYYQWTPLILLFQAMLFYFPRMFWMAFTGYSLNLKKLLQMADGASLANWNDRKQIVEGTVHYLMKYLKMRNYVSTQYKTMSKFKEVVVALGFHKGNYLVFVFLTTSLLYAASTLFQIWMVDILLGINFKTLGYDFLLRAVNGEYFNDQQRFPTVSYCDFDLRQMRNLQTWTVQCSLPINLFAEKVFIVDWFILVSMTTINVVYFLYNLVATILPYRAEDYVQKFLVSDGVRAGRQQQIVRHLTSSQKEFVHSYLRRDGVFIIWLFSNKINQVIASEIVIELWNKYTQ